MKNIKENIVFYISLLWLSFPIYFSLKYNNYLFFIATIIMGSCVISSLYMKDKNVINYMWVYMSLYVIIGVLYMDYNMYFCILYQSSLLNFQFKETKIFNFKSFKMMMFLATLSAVNCIILYKIYVGKMQIYGIFVLAVIMFWHLVTRAAAIDDIKKEKIYKQNQYINSLLVENERNRIGRDLHDTLGHIFATISLKSELAMKLVEKNSIQEVKKEIDDINKLSKKSMKDVRHIISKINYMTLKEEITQLENILKLGDIDCSINIKCDIDKLSPTIQSNISMVMREAINNVIKHSKASFCNINIYDDTDIVVEIRDNGIGFDSNKNYELTSIKSRLDIIGGEVSIINFVKPTIVKMKFPNGIIEDNI